MNELRDSVLQSFRNAMARDSKLKRLLAKARSSGSYEDANEFAVRLGELMSDSMVQSVGNIDRFTEELARELVTDPLASVHEIVAEVAKTVQRNILDANGSGLEALVPDLDTNRIGGFVSKLTSYDNAQDAEWMLKEPVINYSQAIVDQSMRKNMDANKRAGYKPTVVRKAEPHGTRQRIQRVRANGKVYAYQRTYEVPCEWCKNLAGTYDYDEVKQTGEDVWRRHEGCRCTLTYHLGNRTDVVWSREDSEQIQLKAERKEREQRAVEQRKARRASMVNTVMNELGYSAKGASIFVNVHKDMIEKVGLEATIDFARHG